MTDQLRNPVRQVLLMLARGDSDAINRKAISWIEQNRALLLENYRNPYLQGDLGPEEAIKHTYAESLLIYDSCVLGGSTWDEAVREPIVK